MTRAERLAAAILRHAEEVRCRPESGPYGEADAFREHLLAKAERVAS